MTFTSTFNTFNDFLPPPVDKVHAPLKSNPGSATEACDCIISIYDVIAYDNLCTFISWNYYK